MYDWYQLVEINLSLCATITRAHVLLTHAQNTFQLERRNAGYCSTFSKYFESNQNNKCSGENANI